MNLFISDFFYDSVNGGAESYDDVIIKYFKINDKIQSKDFDINHINSLLTLYKLKDLKLFISNFAHLDIMSIDFIVKTGFDYVIIEHDYKFHPERHVTMFKNQGYIVPKDSINPVIRQFYENAKFVILQAGLHEKIFKDNLGLSNIFNLKGSLYDDKSLEILKNCKKMFDNNKIKVEACVVESSNYNKGTDLSSKYCKDNNIEFDLISGEDFEEFNHRLTDYETLVYIPRILESCSRNVIEAKCIGLNVITKNTPIALEKDFIDSDDKIEYLRNCRERLFDCLSLWINR